MVLEACNKTVIWAEQASRMAATSARHQRSVDR